MSDLRQECRGAGRLVFMREGEVREVWINSWGAACSQSGFIYACPKPVMTWHLLLHRRLRKVAVTCVFWHFKWLFFYYYVTIRCPFVLLILKTDFFKKTFLPTSCTIPAPQATTMPRIWTNTGSCNTLAPCDQSTWSSPTSSIERGCRR